MGVAFGMCGYPEEGGNKNSTQSKFTESLSLLCDGGSRCVAQTDKAGVAPLAHPGYAGKAVGRALHVGI